MKRKLNWVDLIIVLAVVIIGVGAWVRLGNRVERVAPMPTEFVYQVEVRKVRSFSVDALERSIGYPFNLDDRARSDDMGILEVIDVRPAMEEVELNNGTTRRVEIPNRYDVVLTMRINGSVSDIGYLTPQLSNIGAGAKIVFTSKFARVQGHIIEVIGEDV
jgi:hypothetical protein